MNFRKDADPLKPKPVRGRGEPTTNNGMLLPKLPEKPVSGLPVPEKFKTSGNVVPPKLPSLPPRAPLPPTQDAATPTIPLLPRPPAPQPPQSAAPVTTGFKKVREMELFPESQPNTVYDLDDETEEVNIDEDTNFVEASDSELYEEIFGEKMPHSYDPTATITDEEDELLERKYEASSEGLPIPTLYALASDDDSDVREGVAANPSTPVELLTILASDVDDFVRQSVMENPIISDELFEKFGSDDELFVFLEWLDMERTTPKMVEKLAFTVTDELVADFLVDSPKLSETTKTFLRRKFNLKE